MFGSRVNISWFYQSNLHSRQYLKELNCVGNHPTLAVQALINLCPVPLDKDFTVLFQLPIPPPATHCAKHVLSQISGFLRVSGFIRHGVIFVWKIMLIHQHHGQNTLRVLSSLFIDVVPLSKDLMMASHIQCTHMGQLIWPTLTTYCIRSHQLLILFMWQMWSDSNYKVMK